MYLYIFEYGDVHSDATFSNIVFAQIFSNNSKKQSKINTIILFT